jgi:hypothetical protein
LICFDYVVAAPEPVEARTAPSKESARILWFISVSSSIVTSRWDD